MKRAFNDSFPAPKGRIELCFYNADGEEVGYLRVDNLVVDSGRAMMAAAAGVLADSIGLGTNGAAAAPGDVAPLADQVIKAVDAVTYPDPRTTRFAFTIDTDEFNDQTIREMALLHTVGESAVLFARRGGLSIDKSEDIRIVGTWTINF